MDVGTGMELSLYAIAVIGSFLQYSFAQVFKFIEEYGKGGERWVRNIKHSHDKLEKIELAVKISFWAWVVCIICVGLALFSYITKFLIGSLPGIENVVGCCFSLFLMCSIAAFISVYKYYTFLQTLFLR